MQLGFVSAILPDLSFEDVFSIAQKPGRLRGSLLLAGREGRNVVMRASPCRRAERDQRADGQNPRRRGIDRRADQRTGVLSQPSQSIEEKPVPQLLTCRPSSRPLQNWGLLESTRLWDVTGSFPLTKTGPISRNLASTDSVAEDLGVRIGIENCPMLFSADEWPGGKNLATCPAIWTRMFSDIPSPSFGLNYDPSHMIWQHMGLLECDFSVTSCSISPKDVRIDRARLDQVASPPALHTPKLPGLAMSTGVSSFRH